MNQSKTTLAKKIIRTVSIGQRVRDRSQGSSRHDIDIQTRNIPSAASKELVCDGNMDQQIRFFKS